MDLDPRSRGRILYVAHHVVAEYRLSPDLAEDFTQDLLVQILDPTTTEFWFSTRYLTWRLRALCRNWIQHKSKPYKKLASTYLRASPPPSALKLLELQEIWNTSTRADRDAITDLLVNGRKPYRGDDPVGLGISSSRRCRLKRLRQKLQGATRVRKKATGMRKPCFQLRVPTELAARLNEAAVGLVGSPLLVKVGYSGGANPLPLTVVTRLLLELGLEQVEEAYHEQRT